MKQSFFNLVLAILAALALIIPFTGKVHDGRRKWFKGFTKRGWLLVGVALVGVLISYLKDWQAELDDMAKENTVKSEKKRDAYLAYLRTDESNIKTIKAFTTSLAKYGLKYDSTQKVIQKLVLDSSKRSVKIVNRNEPELGVTEITQDSSSTFERLFLKIAFISHQASAYHLKINLFVIYEDNHVLKFQKTSNPFLSNNQLEVDNVNTLKVGLNNYHTINKIIFLFSGTYENLKGITFKFDDLLLYDLNTKGYGSVALQDFKRKILTVFKENGVGSGVLIE